MSWPWWQAPPGSEGPIARAVAAPFGAVAWLYGAGGLLHRAAYDRGLLQRRSLPCRVVSVGSPCVGGSGKTPIAGWIAQGLAARGHKVVLASRGYGRIGAEPVHVVSDGKSLLGQVEASGDEPLWLAARVPGVPVLVGPDRGLVGLRAIGLFDCEVMVLDDGFHHHRLARDLDLVTLDGRFGLGNGRVLPRGPLGEPVSSLGRAHGVVVLDPPLAEQAEPVLREVAPDAARFDARRIPSSLRILGRAPTQALDPLELLRGAEVGMLASIARPDSFRATLESLGARVVAQRTFRDHHRYHRRDLRGLSRQAPTWVTTEKDAPKLQPSWGGGADLWVLGIETRFEEGDRFLLWMESRLGLGAQQLTASV